MEPSTGTFRPIQTQRTPFILSPSTDPMHPESGKPRGGFDHVPKTDQRDRGAWVRLLVQEGTTL